MPRPFQDIDHDGDGLPGDCGSNARLVRRIGESQDLCEFAEHLQVISQLDAHADPGNTGRNYGTGRIK
jgi:hypothetical protein